MNLKFIFVLNEIKIDNYIIKKDEVGIIAC